MHYPDHRTTQRYWQCRTKYFNRFCSKRVYEQMSYWRQRHKKRFVLSL